MRGRNGKRWSRDRGIPGFLFWEICRFVGNLARTVDNAQCVDGVQRRDGYVERALMRREGSQLMVVPLPRAFRSLDAGTAARRTLRRGTIGTFAPSRFGNDRRGRCDDIIYSLVSQHHLCTH